MPGRGPFARWRSARTAYIWTDDEDQGLPGAPDPIDFVLPMPKAEAPRELHKRQPAAATVILATALVVAVTVFDWHNSGLSFASSRDAVFSQGHWHLLVLAMLSHADLAHLLSNLLGFVAFGYLLKRSFGVLAFPLIPALCGVIITLLTNTTTPPGQGLIGSSGVVFAMVGLYVTLYYFFERRYSWQSRLVRITGFLLLLFFPHEYSHDISYLAHAYGFALGVISGLIMSPYLKADHHPQALPSIAERLHPSS